MLPTRRMTCEYRRLTSVALPHVSELQSRRSVEQLVFRQQQRRRLHTHARMIEAGGTTHRARQRSPLPTLMSAMPAQPGCKRSTSMRRRPPVHVRVSTFDQWQSPSASPPSGCAGIRVYPAQPHQAMTRQSPEGSGGAGISGACAPDRAWIDKPRWRRTRRSTLPVAGAEAQDRPRSGANSATLTKHKLAESVDLESSATGCLHGSNNYLSLFGTRRDQLLVEPKFTPGYWRWIERRRARSGGRDRLRRR